MGNSASKKMDRYYGNYEKNFERVEKDMQRVKVRVCRVCGVVHVGVLKYWSWKERQHAVMHAHAVST